MWIEAKISLNLPQPVWEGFGSKQNARELIRSAHGSLGKIWGPGYTEQPSYYQEPQGIMASSGELELVQVNYHLALDEGGALSPDNQKRAHLEFTGHIIDLLQNTLYKDTECLLMVSLVISGRITALSTSTPVQGTAARKPIPAAPA